MNYLVYNYIKIQIQKMSSFFLDGLQSDVGDGLMVKKQIAKKKELDAN